MKNLLEKINSTFELAKESLNLQTVETLHTYEETWASRVALVVLNLPAKAGDTRDMDSTPGPGRSPGGGHDDPLQYFCLENPLDRGAWWATVHRVAKSRTQLKPLSACVRVCVHTHTHTQKNDREPQRSVGLHQVCQHIHNVSFQRRGETKRSGKNI